MLQLFDAGDVFHFSTPFSTNEIEEMRAMRKLVPKHDRVKNKDRQNPVKVLKISNNGVINYLKDIGLTGHTAIPETSKFTNNNKVGMYSNPVGLLIGSYVSICMLTQLINLKLLHQHLKVH